jgi:hypothetical protein
VGAGSRQIIPADCGGIVTAFGETVGKGASPDHRMSPQNRHVARKWWGELQND